MKDLEKENQHLSKDLLQSLVQMVEKQLQSSKREQQEVTIGQFPVLPLCCISISFVHSLS
jgi:hypothetical protein